MAEVAAAKLVPASETVVSVALEVPLYRYFDYRVDPSSTGGRSLVGRRVCVPFGSRRQIGVVIAEPAPTAADDQRELRAIEAIVDDGLPALPPEWFALCDFTAAYYQAPLGEVMLQALPKGLRRLDPPKPRKARRPPAAGTAQTPPALRSVAAPAPPLARCSG